MVIALRPRIGKEGKSLHLPELYLDLDLDRVSFSNKRIVSLYNITLSFVKDKRFLLRTVFSFLSVHFNILSESRI